MAPFRAMDHMELKIPLEKREAVNLNPLTLAFVGDSVFENFVRERIILRDPSHLPHKLHLEAIKYVKAANQSFIVQELEKELTEEEVYMYKRGRNMKSFTVPKNAKVLDYRRASGFETLIGYLHMTGGAERLKYLMEKAALAIETRDRVLREAREAEAKTEKDRVKPENTVRKEDENG